MREADKETNSLLEFSINKLFLIGRISQIYNCYYIKGQVHVFFMTKKVVLEIIKEVLEVLNMDSLPSV